MTTEQRYDNLSQQEEVNTSVPLPGTNSACVKISAVIITLNEEKKIERCLQSLDGLVDEIVVVDSFSTDGTASICEKYGARFIRNKFEGYVAQKNFALDQVHYDHVLSLDADEVLSDEMKASIARVKSNWGHYSGYSFNRFNNYCGKWIHHCGWYPDRKIRLWDRRKAKWSGTDPHDHILLPKNEVCQLQGDILHYSYVNIDEHVRQMHNFAAVAARAKYLKGNKPLFIIHVILSPLYKFTQKYFIQLGFLDGYYGFLYCAIESALNFFKYAKLYEYRRVGLPEKGQIKK